MRKLYFLLSIALFSFIQPTSAQAPSKMSYQAVIRNSTNHLVTNQQIGMQISILQGSADGTVVYSETQTPMTNDNGLISIEIGNEAGFDAINWANGPYFIKTETDPEGGTNYTITATSQLLSVPYAIHAKTAENVTGTINETDPVFSAWDKSSGISISKNQVNDLPDYLTTETDPVFGASPAAGITAADTTKWNNKLTGFTESDPVYATSPAASIKDAGSQRVITYDERIKLKYLQYGAERNVQADWAETDSTKDAYIANKPASFNASDETDPVYSASVASNITAADTTRWHNKLESSSLALVATSGNYSDLSNKPSLATVATSGSYTDLSNTPDFTGWDTNASDDFDGDYNSLTNKPTLATVATSGKYSDLTGTPALSTVATSGNYSDLSNKPSLATVATSGSYTDLSNTPDFTGWDTNASDDFDGDYNSLTNKPTLATVATSGKYSDLTGTPTLSTVATSGNYSDLSNKPSLATVATSGSYNDLSNKPTTDGSETKIIAGTNVTVTGSGTSASPYVINSSSAGSSGPTIKNVSGTTTLTSSDEVVFCAGAFSGGPTYTVYLPSSPSDGQYLEICTKNGNVTVEDLNRSVFVSNTEQAAGTTLMNFSNLKCNIMIFRYSSTLDAWFMQY